MKFRAYAAASKGAPLEPFEYDPGPLQADQVEIAIQSCGICHSDLSMLKNAWGMSRFPLVPGHEVVGTVAQVGSNVTHLKAGDRVGVGWTSQSCMHCRACMSGDHNLCPKAEGIIVGRHGGFADRVRCHWGWATRLPDKLPSESAGPLFCGGITVFNPIVQYDVKPTDRVGVVGIGGLGHMAVMMLDKWGCEVVAFTSEPKRAEAIQLGADHAVSSRDSAEIKKWAGRLDFLLVTVNVPLDWKAYLEALSPKGRIHFVGALLQPVPIPPMSLIFAQKQISGTPLGSPATTAVMLDFCARHNIVPKVETFPMAKVNDAIAHVESGAARYRVVLTN